MGEWSDLNLENLKRILRCFHLASGLVVSLKKSKVYGVGVGEEEEACSMASHLNCQKGYFPFVHLSLMIGANMNRAANSKVVTNKFNSRLSSWKACSLSFAGRSPWLKPSWASFPAAYAISAKNQVLMCDSYRSVQNIQCGGKSAFG
ncbi:hypothetical protein HanRHA438_Chr16g0773441 [Helianthus annuus]|nr:hypothetical protein HanRHA438_Chr16g0773441 [Helianthus annuus]